MKTWSIQDAEARFSAMLDACRRRLWGAPARTLEDLLLSNEGRGELNVPLRGKSSITKSER